MDYREELILEVIRNILRIFYPIYRQYGVVVDYYEMQKRSWKNQLRCSAEKSRPGEGACAVPSIGLPSC